jgi:NAD(P)-dependent dehydrogenase (short-subunit alcohol dehydrogenase family)
MTADIKVAFITGGNRGLGLETARQLGKLGIKTVIGSRDIEKGEQAAKSLRADGADVDAIRFDITKPADYKAAYDYFDSHYGKLDILINNAGINRETLGGPNVTSSISPAALRETFDTNFFAVVELTQTLLPLIRKSPAGRIVNLSSILGSLTLHSDPASRIYDGKYLGYNTSKVALNSFTIHLAHELKDTPIKVNSAHPGWVKTEMGTDAAPMELPEGAKTSVELATLPADGPTGGYSISGRHSPGKSPPRRSSRCCSPRLASVVGLGPPRSRSSASLCDPERAKRIEGSAFSAMSLRITALPFWSDLSIRQAKASSSCSREEAW